MCSTNALHFLPETGPANCALQSTVIPMQFKAASSMPLSKSLRTVSPYILSPSCASFILDFEVEKKLIAK